MKGFIVYSTYNNLGEETVVRLFGRLENGQSFATINSFKPYLFAKKKDLKNVDSKTKKYATEENTLSNFAREEVVKIVFDNQIELNKFYEKAYKEIDTYEADMKPHIRFIIDNNLLGSIDIEGEYVSSEKIDRVYHNPEIKAAEFKPKLKVVSLDIESSDRKDGKLICLGIYSEGIKKNFMITQHELENVTPCKDEAECLEKFKEALLKIDPDVITGWNVIDFDFVYLKELFKKNHIEFDLGRNNDNVRLRIESNFFKASSVDITGRQVLDGLNLIKDPFIKEAPTIKHAKFESLALEDVSQEILGRGKIIAGEGRHEEINRLYKENTKKSHQKIADYNLMDCQLVYDILEKTKIMELGIERSQLTGLTLDRLTASILAFDSLYIRTARSKGLVSPTTKYKEKEKRIEGGYVQSLEPGIYKNVLVFDFKSLYPSVIRTFNIDPASFLEKKEKGCITAPNGASFRNEEGILPQILERLFQAREKAKKEKRELSNHAIKVIMNSFFGVLANENCRYFDLRIANAITHFGQFIIKLTAKEIENKFKHKVIYSDTDSIFLVTNLGKQKANELGLQIEKFVNNFYNEYIKKNYARKSFLELEFEKQYISMMIPKIRGKSEKAAKKRYAGLVEENGKEKIEIVGLEAIRGDWTEAAREFQVELLKKVFHDEPIEKFIKEYVKKIKEGSLDKKLVYRKSIRKALNEYVKTTPPHVKAARQLEVLESNIISYYTTVAGPEPIQKLKHKIDYEHYIRKQIQPIANQILNILNKKFEDISSNSAQTKLF